MPVLQVNGPGFEAHFDQLFFKLKTKYSQILSLNDSCRTQATPWFTIDCSARVTNEITG